MSMCVCASCKKKKLSSRLEYVCRNSVLGRTGKKERERNKDNCKEYLQKTQLC